METYGELITALEAEQKRMGKTPFIRYMDRVFGFLQNIPEEETYTVDNLAVSENRKIFTYLVTLYIADCDPQIEFIDNTLKQFKRCKTITYAKPISATATTASSTKKPLKQLIPQ